MQRWSLSMAKAYVSLWARGKDTDEAMHEIDHDTDRSAGIVAAAFLENQLEDTLRMHLCDDPKVAQLQWERQEVTPASVTVGPDAYASLFYIQDDGLLKFTTLVEPRHFPKSRKGREDLLGHSEGNFS
jgi:hypothetical protein